MCSICCKGFQGVLSGGAFRGCTCLKCTNQVVVHQVSKKCIVSSVGALETSAPPVSSALIVLLVHLRQVHPLRRQVHPLEGELHPLERHLHPLVAPPLLLKC